MSSDTRSSERVLSIKAAMSRERSLIFEGAKSLKMSFKRIGVQAIGEVSKLIIYPIKSCAGIELDSARVTKRGLETISSSPVRDREFMLVDYYSERTTGCHKFLTQRDRGLQKMSLITPRLRASGLELSFDGQYGIEIPDKTNGKELPVRVYNSIVNGIDQGDQIARAFSEYLDRQVRLVRASGSFHRSANQNYVKNDNALSYQDAYPISWMYQESVSELGRLLGYKISYLNFRPNVVATGGLASSEHTYYHVRLGEIEGIQPKPSTRCMITNVEQETGTMPRGRELPLQAIYNNYNWVDRDGHRQGIFAENFLPTNEGVLRKSDEIAGSSLRVPPLDYGRASFVTTSNS